jgi:hypothetical protein
MNPEENKTPEQLEREIAMTRVEMDHTLHAIQNRLSPDTLIHQAVDYVRHHAGGYASNLGTTVKQNPVPFTMLGISLGWLMMTGRTGPRYEEFRDYSETSSPGAMERLGSAMRSTGEKVDDTVQSAKDTAASVGGKISETLHGAGERARSARAWARSTGSSARVSMGQWTSEARERYYRARHGFETTYNEYPLILGALGVAFGAALGASLPSTRREDEWMGTMSDDVVDRTKRVVKDEFDRNREKIESVADKAMQAVREEAQKQGLTPEGAKTTDVP